ncbi:TonB C-terminal domain-containing protein [Gloeobacter kilaueensis]|uniref:TonB n=1 Tax=Gloeobacter kilaueensis (strain ATCC BAA-2537 / CCAP 1431/1 / ULC 316 / JS1) TaxID=1183438 RepID=U5QND6_GLOK1|nr:TonB C-terminal domain-containing protein [Gloeobacter kilaueensis]AGY59119.1 TonB [Gloeobacter kilaueensis JS1]
MSIARRILVPLLGGCLFLLVANCSLMAATQMRQFYSDDFPVKVYISPYLAGSTETDETKRPRVPEAAYNALRQAVLDWDLLMINSPDKPLDRTYTIVLKQKLDVSDATRFAKFGFLVLTDQPGEADLFVEASDLKTFDLKDGKEALGYFSAVRSYRLGKIAMAIHQHLSSELRVVLLHEIGHALGLDHVADDGNESSCNLMSPTKYTCSIALPACRGNSELCIGILDSQIRQIEKALTSERPINSEPVAAKPQGTQTSESQAATKQQETTTTAVAIKTKVESPRPIATIQDWIAEFQRKIKAVWDPPEVEKDARTVLTVVVDRAGHVGEVAVKESAGLKSIDEAAIAAVHKAGPFVALPGSYKEPEVYMDFTLDVHAGDDKQPGQ